MKKLLIFAVMSLFFIPHALADSSFALTSVLNNGHYYVGQQAQVRFNVTNNENFQKSASILITTDAVSSVQLSEINGTTLTLADSLTYAGKVANVLLNAHQTKTYVLSFTPQRIGSSERVTVSLLSDFSSGVVFNFEVLDYQSTGAYYGDSGYDRSSIEVISQSNPFELGKQGFFTFKITNISGHAYRPNPIVESPYQMGAYDGTLEGDVISILQPGASRHYTYTFRPSNVGTFIIGIRMSDNPLHQFSARVAMGLGSTHDIFLLRKSVSAQTYSVNERDFVSFQVTNISSASQLVRPQFTSMNADNITIQPEAIYLAAGATKHFFAYFTPRYTGSGQITVGLIGSAQEEIFTFDVITKTPRQLYIPIHQPIFSGTEYEFTTLYPSDEYVVNNRSQLTVRIYNRTNVTKNVTPQVSGDFNLDDVRLVSRGSARVTPGGYADFTLSFLPRNIGTHNLFVNLSDYPTEKLSVYVVRGSLKPYIPIYEHINHDVYVSRAVRTAKYVRDYNNSGYGYLVRFQIKNAAKAYVNHSFEFRMSCVEGNYENGFRIDSLSLRGDYFDVLIPEQYVDYDCSSFRISLENTEAFESDAAQQNNTKRFYFKKSGRNYSILPSRFN